MRFFSIVLAIIFPVFCLADAVIFSGSDVKALKYNLDLFGRSKVMGLNVDPSAGGGVSAPLGSLGMDYLTGEIYYKFGAGNTDWRSISGAVTGPANTFAGYNSGGVLDTIPNWDIVTYAGAVGLETFQTYIAPTDSGPVTQKIHTYELEIDPDVSTSQQNIINSQFDVHVDRTGSNNDFTGSVNSVIMNLSHEGDGTVGNLTTLGASLSLGTGSNTGTSGNSSVGNFSGAVNTGYTTPNLQGVNVGLSGSGSLTNATIYNGTSTIDVSGATTGVDIGISGDSDAVNGININLSGDVATSSYGANIAISGAHTALNVVNAGVTSPVTNDFNGFSLSHNNNVGGNSKLVTLSSSGDVTGDLAGFFANLSGTSTTRQGLQISSSGQTNGSNNLINLVNSADAVGGTSNISMVSAANSGDGNIIIGANISSSGDSSTFAGGLAVSLTGTHANTIAGINIDVGGATVTPSMANPTGKKVTIQSSGGAINASGEFTTIDSFAALVDSGHIITSALNIESGTPITGTDFLGANLTGLLIAEDDYSPSAFGLGWSAVGLVGQLSVTSGNTVDVASFMVAGGSIPISSTGGTITDFSLYRGAGVATAGGALNITNLYGFKYEDMGGAAVTNEWAFYNDTVAPSFLEGSLDLGTTLTFRESGGGSDLVILQAPGGMSASYTLTFPLDDGTSGQALTTDGSGNLAWTTIPTIPINLSSEVTGVLPLANGGTNKGLTAANGGIVWTDSDSMEILAAGSSGQLLTSGGAGSPAWTTLLPIANGGTNKALTLSAGGVPYFDADSFEVLAAGTAGQYLRSGGSSAPTWETVSGTYTPTLTNGTNIASSSANTCMYSRSNLTVTVTCPITVTCTAAAPTQSIIAATIPIASNFTGSQQAIGLAGCLGSQGCGLASGTPMTGVVSADAANDRVDIEFWCTSTGSNRVLFAFWQYRIL